LKVDFLADIIFSAHEHSVSDIEKVVAGYAEMDGAGVCRLTSISYHLFVVGIDIGFLSIRGLVPIPNARLKLFHSEVSAFHNANLDGCSTLRNASHCPFREFFLNSV